MAPAVAPAAPRRTVRVVGAGWLYSIAVLSLINTVVLLLGSDISMIFGLTSTWISVFMFNKVISIAITIVLAAAFAALGYKAAQGAQWVLITAIVLYLADAAVAGWAVFVVGDDNMFLDLGAHVFVLWFLVKGVLQLRALRAARTANVPAVQGADGL